MITPPAAPVRSKADMTAGGNTYVTVNESATPAATAKAVIRSLNAVKP